MAEEKPSSMQQENADDATAFQVQANAGSQVSQAGQDINQITQTSEGNQNQVLGQVMESVILYVSGGQPIINLAQPGEKGEAQSEPVVKDIGSCPYRGLLAYHEKNAEYFFGRSKEVGVLWTRFRDLHSTNTKTRFLPVYGPSGSGKSSLVRAGLIPALAKQPLSGKDKARVAVMVPGAHPLEKLAGLLANIYQPGITAFSAARQLARELAIANQSGQFDGLHGFASNMLTDIQTIPLVLVVDQFEEVYSLCKDVKERNAFIGSLLYAATEVSQYISVIVTCRSDFLGETSQNSQLNRLFSEHGFLAPNMDEQSLREAISQPAEQAGHPLGMGTINLLIEQTEGRDGALPLLQFALTQIWGGMAKGIEPATTLKEVGGVGGALADTAQRIYDNLDPQQQKIARRCFLELVQLGEGSQDTRRRATVSSLISTQDQQVQVQAVIQEFSSPGARLITLSSEGGEELAEVSHEALLNNWGLMRQWLDQDRDLLRQQRRIEASAMFWREQGEEEGYFLQGLPLKDAVHFENQFSDSLPLSIPTKEFIRCSLEYEQIHDLLQEKWRIEETAKEWKRARERNESFLLRESSLNKAILLNHYQDPASNTFNKYQKDYLLLSTESQIFIKHSVRYRRRQRLHLATSFSVVIGTMLLLIFFLFQRIQNLQEPILREPNSKEPTSEKPTSKEPTFQEPTS